MLSLQFRKECWGKDLIGVTFAHFTELVPVISNNLFDLTPDQQHRYFLGVLSTNIVSELHVDCHNHHFARSQPFFHPFMGQSTSDKLEKINLAPDKNSPTLSRVLSLLDLHAFTKVQGSNFSEHVIEPLLACYSNLPVSNLSPFAPTKQSGSSTHRLRVRSWRMQISPNERHNRYQLARLESTPHDQLRGDQTDYNLNFLHTYCLELNVMLGELLFQERISPRTEHRWYFVTTTCPSCLIPVDDSPIMIPRSLPDVRIAPQNPYVTLTRGELEDIYDAVESAATLRSVKRARQDPLLDKIGDFQYKLEVARSSMCHDLLIKAVRYRRETLQEGPGLRDRDVIGPRVRKAEPK